MKYTGGFNSINTLIILNKICPSHASTEDLVTNILEMFARFRVLNLSLGLLLCRFIVPLPNNIALSDLLITSIRIHPNDSVHPVISSQRREFPPCIYPLLVCSMLISYSWDLPPNAAFVSNLLSFATSSSTNTITLPCAVSPKAWHIFFRSLSMYFFTRSWEKCHWPKYICQSQGRER